MSWCLQLPRNPPRPRLGRAQGHPRRHLDGSPPANESLQAERVHLQARQPLGRLPNPWRVHPLLWALDLGLGLAFGLRFRLGLWFGLGFFVGGGLGFTPINRRAHLEKVVPKIIFRFIIRPGMRRHVDHLSACITGKGHTRKTVVGGKIVLLKTGKAGNGDLRTALDFGGFNLRRDLGNFSG